MNMKSALEKLVAIEEFAGELREYLEKTNGIEDPNVPTSVVPSAGPDEEAEDGDMTEDDINSMALKELLALAKENDVEIPTKIKKDAAAIKILLIGTFFEAEEDTESDEVSELTVEALEGMTLKELLAVAEEYEISLTAKVKKNVEQVRATIISALEESSEEEPTEEEGTAEDIKAMSLKELIAMAKENEVDIPAKIKKDAEAIKELLIAEFFPEAVEEGEAEEEEGYTEEDINQMPLKSLIALAKEAEIEYTAKDAKSADKMKAILIEAICGEEDSEDEGEDGEGAEEAEITEEEIAEMTLADLKVLIKEQELEVPANLLKDVKKLRAFVIESFF